MVGHSKEYEAAIKTFCESEDFVIFLSIILLSQGEVGYGCYRFLDLMRTEPYLANFVIYQKLLDSLPIIVINDRLYDYLCSITSFPIDTTPL